MSAGDDDFDSQPFISMKLHLVLSLWLLAVLPGVSSCATQHVYKGKPTYVEGGQLYCSLHHQKLIHVQGFKQSDKVCLLPGDDYHKWYFAFPNARTEFSDSKGEFFYDPVSYDYCQACRDALAEKLR